MKKTIVLIFVFLLSINFTYATSLSYVAPTDADGTQFIRNYTYINFSSTLWNSNISTFILNWNGTNNTIIDNTLILSFNFNNNTLNESGSWFVDQSIYGHNATCPAGSCPAINKSSYMFGGSSISFNGASGVDIRTRGLSSNPTNVTIMLWVRPDFSSTDATTICGGDSCPIIHFGDQANPRLYVRFEPPNKIYSDDGTGQLFNVQVYWDGAGVPMANTASTVALPAYSSGEWHHVAITGVNVNNLANEPIIIGGGDGTHATSWFKGAMDELRIWNRSLSGNFTSSEINRTRFMEIGKFYINQTALKSGNYTYYGYINATNGQKVTTCSRNYGGSATGDCLSDTTPPEITYYNLTNENGCENWNTNKNDACSTSSVTPTVQFNTNENAWCAIAGGSSSTSLNKNYTDMGSSRNCTGVAAGEGTTSHLCTLTNQDELVYDTSYLFISCKDASNNQNTTSTSEALKLSITGLETAGRNSIGIGIQNALLSGYTNYTDLQIYARNLSNSQVKGTFDRAAKKGSKMWAFNRIGVSDSHVNMFNLTPVLYTLELANKTSSNITLQVEQLINATK